jgi:serine acetyltransferase
MLLLQRELGRLGKFVNRFWFMFHFSSAMKLNPLIENFLVILCLFKHVVRIFLTAVALHLIHCKEGLKALAFLVAFIFIVVVGLHISDGEGLLVPSARLIRRL